MDFSWLSPSGAGRSRDRPAPRLKHLLLSIVTQNFIERFLTSLNLKEEQDLRDTLLPATRHS